MTSRVLAAALAGLAVAAPAASATDYFATTDETALTQDCLTPATACALGRSMVVAPDLTGTAERVGVHTLTLAPGTYNLADVNAGALVTNDLFVDSGLTVQGTAGQPVPTIDVTGTFGTGVVFNGGGTLRDIIVQGSTGEILGGSSLTASGGNPAVPLLIDRVTLAASGTAFVALEVGGQTIVRNSRITQSGPTGNFALSLVGSSAGTPRIINTTVTAPNATALGVGGGGRGPAQTDRFEFVNSVIRGIKDIDVTVSSGGNVALDLKNSAWRPGTPTAVGAAGTTFNQVTPAITADPLLGADGVPGVGSPLIDAGTADNDSGTTDLLGKARTAGSAIDIGAFEFATPAPAPATGNPAPPVVGAPAPDVKAPTATSLKPPKTLKRSKLSKGKGVTLTATLDEAAASAKVELIQITKKKGKAPKEKILGTSTLGASSTSLSFPLKIKSSKLGKGKLKLTLRFTFVDAAGNKTVVDKAVTVS